MLKKNAFKIISRITTRLHLILAC